MASTGFERPSYNDATRKQKELADISPSDTQKDERDAEDAIPYSPDRSDLKPVYDSTHRRLKPRHIQLIGIGGTIGTALFVQIGHGLSQGGPGSLFIAFTIW